MAELRDEGLVGSMGMAAEIKALKAQMAELQKTVDEISPLKGYVDEFSECLRQQTIDYETQAAEWSEYKDETTTSIDALKEQLDENSTATQEQMTEVKTCNEDISDCIQKMTQELQVERLEAEKQREELVDDINSIRRDNEERDAEHNKLATLVQTLLDTFEEVSQDTSKHAMEWEDFREEAGKDFNDHRKLIDYLLSKSGDVKALQAEVQATGGGQIVPEKTFGERVLSAIYASAPETTSNTNTKGASAPQVEGLTDQVNKMNVTLEICQEDIAKFRQERNEMSAKVAELENDIMNKDQLDLVKKDVLAHGAKALSAEQEINNLTSQLKAYRQELNEAHARHESHAGTVKTQLQTASSANSQLQTELQTQISQLNTSLSAQQSQMTTQLRTQMQSDLQAQVSSQVQQAEQRLSQSVSAPATQPTTILPPLAAQKSAAEVEATQSLQKRTGDLERRVTNIYEQVNSILQQDFVTKKDFDEVGQQTWDAIHAKEKLEKEGGVANDLKEEIDKNHRMVWEAVLQLQMKQHQDTKRKDQTILPQGNPESYISKPPGGVVGSLTVNSGTPLRSGAATPTRAGQPAVVRSNSASYLPVQAVAPDGRTSPTPLSPRAVQPHQVIVQPRVITAGGIPQMQTTPVGSRSPTPQPARMVSPRMGGAYTSPVPGRRIVATPNGTQVQVVPAPQAASFPNAQAS